MMPDQPNRSILKMINDSSGDVEKLSRLLRFPDFQVRQAAADEMGTLGRYECLAPLTNALHDPHATVREAAAVALGKISTLPNIRRTLNFLEETPDDVLAMQQLIRELHDKEYRVRVAAANSLKQYGVDACVEAGSQGNLLETETGTSENPRPVYRPYSYPVGELDYFSPAGKKAYPPLYREPPVPDAVLKAEYDLQVYRNLLETGEEDTREAVAWALGMMADVECLPLISMAAHDPAPVVRCSAVNSLARLLAVVPLHEPHNRFEDRNPGDQILSLLVKVLKDKDAMVREAAVMALSLVCTTDIATHITHAATDPSPVVRAAVATCLPMYTWDARAFEAIRKLVKDPDEHTRMAAIQSLRGFRGKAVLDIVYRSIRDESQSVRLNALLTLKALKDHGEGDPDYWAVLLEDLDVLANLDDSDSIRHAARIILEDITNLQME